MGSELMTGILQLGANPLSRISIKSLADLGFEVDATQADSYRLSDASLRVDTGGVGVHLRNDVAQWPIIGVDREGRVVGDATLRGEQRR